MIKVVDYNNNGNNENNYSECNKFIHKEINDKLKNLTEDLIQLLNESKYHKLKFNFNKKNQHYLNNITPLKKTVTYDFYIYKIYSYQFEIKDINIILRYCSDNNTRKYILNIINRYYMSKNKKIFIDKINLTKVVYKNLLKKSMIGDFTNIKLFLEDYKKELYFENDNLFKLLLYFDEINKQLYDLLDEYFDINFVLGVIKVYEILFDIKFVKITKEHTDFDIFYTNTNISLWNVDIYNVYKNDIRIGTCYLDLYKRDEKPEYPCVIECTTENTELPNNYIVCIVSIVIPDKNVKIYPEYITDLFHEFGHFIHRLFCKIPLKNFPKDFLEIPSTLFENFIKCKDILKLLSKKADFIDNNFVSIITKWFESYKYINNINNFRTSSIEIELYETQNDNNIIEIIKKNAFYIYNTHFFSSELNNYSYLYAIKKSDQLYNEYFKGNELNKKYGKHFCDNFLSINNDVPYNIFNNFEKIF